MDTLAAATVVTATAAAIIAAAIIAAAVAQGVGAATAAAEQENQDDNPPATTETIVVTHIYSLRKKICLAYRLANLSYSLEGKWLRFSRDFFLPQSIAQGQQTAGKVHLFHKNL